MKVFYSDHFVLSLPEGHRFPKVKYSMPHERIAASGICGPTTSSAARGRGGAELVLPEDRRLNLAPYALSGTDR